jgi:hypothetical protein
MFFRQVTTHGKRVRPPIGGAGGSRNASAQAREQVALVRWWSIAADRTGNRHTKAHFDASLSMRLPEDTPIVVSRMAQSIRPTGSKP